MRTSLALRWTLALVALCALGWLAGPAHAQGVTTSSIDGGVTDPQKLPAPGVTVVAIHQPSGTKYETITRSDGRFSIPGMRVGGPYLITATLTGFSPGSVKDVFLTLGVAQDVNLALSPATVTEEVVVTAQKRQEKLQDVPLSVTAITGAQLETRGIEGLANLNSLAPTLMFRGNPGTELISTVSLRGSGTGQPAIWVDPSVGMYVDGVYVGKAQGSVFDVLDLERVEVLRGPQGTLFGRNTEGGAVNLVSRRPTGEWGGSVAAEFGNRGQKLGRVSLDLPKLGFARISVAGRMEETRGELAKLRAAVNATGNTPSSVS